jgi:YD repeat-containing protein
LRYDVRTVQELLGHKDALAPKSTGHVRPCFVRVLNLTRITNARGHATTFGYDTVNRLTSVTDALNQTSTYGYDQVGNRTTMRDRRGQQFSYTYDPANRLAQDAGPQA